jgi:hypothetical protein
MEKMGMMRQWQHWPVSSQDVTPSENRPEHLPSAMSIRYNGYVRYTSIQSINQSINQSIRQSISQLINQSISQSINQSIKNSLGQSLFTQARTAYKRNWLMDLLPPFLT